MPWKFLQGPHLYAQVVLGADMEMEQHIRKKRNKEC